MSTEEFDYWVAFNQLEPIGVARESAFFASVNKTLMDITYKENGLKTTDFMLFTDIEVAEPEPQSAEDMLLNLKLFFAGRT